MVKLSLHHLSLTLLIGVLLYINSSDSAIDSCFIAKNVQTLSTCNISCAWEDIDIWKLCPTNSFPDSLDSAFINATGGYTIELSTNTYALGDLSLGSGSQVVKGPNTQVLSITNVGLTAKTIRVQNRGVLDLNLDKTSAAGVNNVSTSLDITFNAGSTLNWRSGVIGINAATFTQLNAFTMNEGTFLNILGSPTLARDLTSKGNITFVANSITTVTNKRTLTFDTASYSLFNQETTIQNGESIGTAGLENLAIKGTTYFDLLGSSANFNILTQVSQPFIVNSGFVKFNKNTTLSGIVIRGGASVDINGLLTTSSSITVAQDATFNWNNGDIKINNGVFENQGTATFQSSKSQPRLYSDSQTGTSIINRHNLIISTPITIKSTPILNYGVVSLPTTSDIGTFRMYNGSIESSGSEMNSLNEFTCTGGVINSGVTINAKGTFSLKDTALVSSVVNVDSGLTATVGGTIKMTSTPTLNITKKTTIDFQSATISALNEDHGIIENYGILQGKVTLDGISLTNFGTIGAKFGPSNPITYISVKNYGLILDDSSSTVIDIFSELTKSEIMVDGGKNQVNFQIGGSLTLRLRKTFTPDSTTTVTFMSWSPITTLVGNFSDIVVDQSDWPNTYGCNAVNVVKDVGKRNYKLTFGGCGTHPTSTGPIIRSVSKTTTILIVLVIVFLIGVCIFFIAWCKKKYKKKPWDRLKDDRF